MREYSRNEIIKFFQTVVNPVLSDFAIELNERGWQTDLQIRNPQESRQWFDSTFSASITASQNGEVRLFYYHIEARATPASSERFHVACRRTVDQPDDQASLVSGIGMFEGDYHRDVTVTTREQFLKDVQEG